MFFIKYLAALSYDFFILLVLFFTLTALIVFFNHGHAIPPATVWYQMALLGTAFFYYHSSIKFGGQTLGMRAWRFQLVSLTKNKLSNQQIFFRFLYFVPALLVAPFYLKSSYTLLNQWTKTHLSIV